MMCGLSGSERNVRLLLRKYIVKVLWRHLAKADHFDNKNGNEKISIHSCRSCFLAICYRMS